MQGSKHTKREGRRHFLSSIYFASLHENEYPLAIFLEGRRRLPLKLQPITRHLLADLASSTVPA